MKTKCVLPLIMLGLVAFASPAVASIEFVLERESGGVLLFPGDSTFSFPEDADFFISSVTGGTGAAVGLPVNVIGTFTIGAITTFSGPPIIESAPVTSSAGAAITIDDGAGFTLMGDLDIDSIFTVDDSGTIQTRGIANVTNLTYGGGNADLQQLVNTAAKEGVLKSSFFAPDSGDPNDPITLSDLANNEYELINYQGRLSSGGEPTGSTDLVPEPASVLVWTVMGLIVGTATFKRRRSGACLAEKEALSPERA